MECGGDRLESESMPRCTGWVLSLSGVVLWWSELVWFFVEFSTVSIFLKTHKQHSGLIFASRAPSRFAPGPPTPSPHLHARPPPKTRPTQHTPHRHTTTHILRHILLLSSSSLFTPHSAGGTSGSATAFERCVMSASSSPRDHIPKRASSIIALCAPYRSR